MRGIADRWDPASPQSWATGLGLVHVPLFEARQPSRIGEASVMLDGRRSSFLMCSLPDPAKLDDNTPLSWSWSCDLRHLVYLDQMSKQLFLARWDSPGTFRRFRFPTLRGAEELLRLMQEAPPLLVDDVVLHALRAFRRIRASLPNSDALQAVRVFNTLLRATELVRQNPKSESDWLRCRTIKDALSFLGKSEMGTEAELLEKPILDTHLNEVHKFLLSPDPACGHVLEPELLLRHAAGQLYQEAHIMIERDQLYLPGLAHEEEPKGMAKPDVRFTPVPLARALVQQAFDALGQELYQKDPIVILDPACGSGVFLQEAMRELKARGFQKGVLLKGFDTSAISCTMARFCLSRSANSSVRGQQFKTEIAEKDALVESWGEPDVILMNPPFGSWVSMTLAERDLVKSALGQLAGKGKLPDKAMGFVWKGVGSLKSGGVLASVVPAPLLESKSGESWRSALIGDAELRLIGRFQGFSFFRHSQVETAFLVAVRCSDSERARKRRENVKVLLAEEGSEESSIRAMRRYKGFPPDRQEDGCELTIWPHSQLSSASWLPRSIRSVRLIEHLSSIRLNKVSELFNVSRGIETGNNSAFILSKTELKKLPEKEQAYFRPVAGSSTIEDGRILQNVFVFFPYGKRGLLFDDEDKLRSKVPYFYEERLKPAKDSLCKRPCSAHKPWWALSRERLWQRDKTPKLLSKTFGQEGSFAYDDKGEYVVFRGHCWLWRGQSDSFHDGPLPWAYLALLNSTLFGLLLSAFCPRVQGGQFDLSKRYLDRVFLPDLSDDTKVTGDVVNQLAKMGKDIQRGELSSFSTINTIATRVYCIPSQLVKEMLPGTAS